MIDLIANIIFAAQQIIKPSKKREWMDNTPKSYAMRCLPLVDANELGFQILTKQKITALFDGQKTTIEYHDCQLPYECSNHFGQNIITWTMSWLFQTPEEYQLLILPPINYCKDGVQGLSAIVNTEWAHMTFTYNALLTRINYPVIFEVDEPICTILPIKKDIINLIEKPLHNNIELQEKFQNWSSSRNKFNSDLQDPTTEAAKLGWQKEYYLHEKKAIIEGKNKKSGKS